MPEYRIYLTAADGRILGPAIVLECADDQEALEKTERTTKGNTALELWQGNRLVLRLPPDEVVESQGWPPA
jgi:hypothetical protein